MKTVFVDTSYFLALLNPRDQHHQSVCRLAKTLEVSLITTDWVLTELANFMAHGPNRSVFSIFLESLRTDEHVTVYEASCEQFDSGVRIFSQRPDKKWSLTDCISMAVMDQESIAEVLTTDHHFAQAGYQTLPG